MVPSGHIFFLMNHVFYGFSLSIIFWIFSSYAVFHIEGVAQFALYQSDFVVTYKCVLSGGLVFGAFILVMKTQSYIPEMIESVFSNEELGKTAYYTQRKKYFSAIRSATFSANFFVGGIFLFYLCGFSRNELHNYFMIIFAALEYAAGVYVGRKLFYIAQMLNAIGRIDVKKEIFKEDKLGGITVYVNAISSMTVISTYFHVNIYYHGEYLFSSLLSKSAREFLMLPAIIAIPVIAIFNFYPRVVLRVLYTKSIKFDINSVKLKMRKEGVSYIDKLEGIVEYDKLLQDELRNRLKANLSDLPVAITIVIAVISILKQ